MYAIIETGGKQVKAEPGSFIDVEKLSKDKGENISFDILMLVQGKDTLLGTPKLKNAKVNGQIIGTRKNDKIIVYKMRPKKGYKRKQGHRQELSRIFVESIEIDGKKIKEVKLKSK